MSASNNVLRYITEYPARGLIFDRNGELLVHNQAAYDLMVIPRQVSAFDTVEFCSILGVPKEFLERELKEAKRHSSFRPSALIKQLSAESCFIKADGLNDECLLASFSSLSKNSFGTPKIEQNSTVSKAETCRGITIRSYAAWL